MENLRIDDFKNYNFLSNLQYSPNGDAVAVVVSKSNSENGYDKAIFVDKGQGFFPLTSLKGRVGSYIWQDDDSILFLETRDKSAKDKQKNGHELTTAYKISINGGEAQLAFEIKANVVGIEKLNDTEYALSARFDNLRPDLTGKTPEETEKILKEHKKEKDYQIVDELPFWFNGQGFINKKRSRLYKFSEEGGLEPLTGALDSIGEWKVSPCGKSILFAGNLAPFEVREIKSNLYLLDIKSKDIVPLLDEPEFIKAFDFYGESFALASAKGDKYNFGEHPTFYILERDKSRKELLEYDLSLGSAANSDSAMGGGINAKMHGCCFYFTSMDNYTTEVRKLCLKSGKLSDVTSCGESVHFFDISERGLVFCSMKGSELQEVFELVGGETKKKSNFNAKVLENKKISAPEHHIFTDKDGYKIDGWVLKPADYEAGKKYPAIVNIHGGPKTAYGTVFFHEMQYWANCGYFVAFCNPRGSDGKGNDFADIRGKYGTVDYDNIMQFVDEICQKYADIDQDRLGVTGGSYGGFMTNWIIGHTHRFAAAATQRCISNWIGFGLISDIGYFFGTDQMQADAWTDVEKLWWHSPLKYIPNAKTPTLILHSDEDYRCWIPEAYQLFTALKLHGVETRLHIFHGENHELSRSGKPDHRVRRLEEITNWMDKYLKQS